MALQLRQLARSSPPEAPQIDQDELEARVSKLERGQRELELEWVNVHSKIRSAIGRIDREKQVEEGKHKGGRLPAGNSGLAEEGTPLSLDELSDEELWAHARRKHGNI